MFENLNTIILQGKTYPIRCDINVCEAVQDEFGSLPAFERKLLGLEFQRDEMDGLKSEPMRRERKSRISDLQNRH